MSSTRFEKGECLYANPMTSLAGYTGLDLKEKLRLLLNVTDYIF
ncbi:hypothetical protein [Neobacillus sp. Marseille-QA0830]